MFLTSFDVQEGVQQTVKRQLSTKLNNNVFNGCPGKTNSKSKISSLLFPNRSKFDVTYNTVSQARI